MFTYIYIYIYMLFLLLVILSLLLEPSFGLQAPLLKGGPTNETVSTIEAGAAGAGIDQGIGYSNINSNTIVLTYSNINRHINTRSYNHR